MTGARRRDEVVGEDRRRPSKPPPYNPHPVPSTQRILEQLLLTDRMIGVEAAPRVRFAQPAPPVRGPAPAARPGPAVRLPPPPGAGFTPSVPRGAAPTPRPSPVPPAAGPAAAWKIHEEIPLIAAAPAPLDILFIAVEWGQPFDAPVRELFNRQLGAMKVPQERAALLRLACSGSEEPGAGALAEAKIRALEAVAQNNPKTAVLFGGFSIKALCGGSGSLALSRGKWFSLEGSSCPARATWHPSQLGVDRDRRLQTWEDLQAVMAKLAAHQPQ